MQAGKRNFSWQGQAGTGLVLLGRAAWNPIAGLGPKGKEVLSADTWRVM